MTFDKDKYWENRKAGKRGQGKGIVKAPVPVIPDSAHIAFTEDGTLTIKNREFRRQRTKLAPKTSQLRKKGKRKKK